MNVTTLPTIAADLLNISPIDAHVYTAYLRPNVSGSPLFNTYVTVAGVTTIMTSDQHFALVSSLYGPGSLACWLLLLLSVVIS
jgi:hypothetical protein